MTVVACPCHPIIGNWQLLLVLVDCSSPLMNWMNGWCPGWWWCCLHVNSPSRILWWNLPEQRITFDITASVVGHVQLREQREQHLDAANWIQCAVYRVRYNGLNILQGIQKKPFGSMEFPSCNKKDNPYLQHKSMRCMYKIWNIAFRRWLQT